jgi:uncharacterized protein YjbI with pentapeptide repeats
MELFGVRNTETSRTILIIAVAVVLIVKLKLFDKDKRFVAALMKYAKEHGVQTTAAERWGLVGLILDALSTVLLGVPRLFPWPRRADKGAVETTKTTTHVTTHSDRIKKPTSTKNAKPSTARTGTARQIANQNIETKSSGADSIRRDLRNKRYTQEDFSRDTTRENFNNCDLRGANFSGVVLDHSMFMNSLLNQATFDGFIGENVSFLESNLTGASFVRAILPSAKFSGVILESARLDNARLHGADLSLARLSGASLRGASLIPQMPNSEVLDIINSGFTRKKIESASSQAQHTNLMYADLSNTDLTAADLSRAVLVGANLSGATLDGANLWRANLSGAIITGANFTNAKFSETIMPDGSRRG